MTTNQEFEILIEPEITYNVKLLKHNKIEKEIKCKTIKDAYEKRKELEKELDNIQILPPVEKTKAEQDDRITKIKIASKKKQDEEKRKKEEYESQVNNEKEKIRQLAPRISNMIDLANACVKNNIEIYKKAPNHRDRNLFLSDGITHYTGLIAPWRTEFNGKEYKYIGIINGGACGNTDLRVNKNGKAFGWRENSTYPQTYSETEPRLVDLKQFLKEFDELEKEFLNFIDNL